jgi:hypothetical protein
MEIFDPALKAVLTLTAALFVKTICELRGTNERRHDGGGETGPGRWRLQRSRSARPWPSVTIGIASRKPTGCARMRVSAATMAVCTTRCLMRARVAARAQVTDFRKLHRARWLTSEDFDASLAQEPHPPNS